jgi:hypothetical protein
MSFFDIGLVEIENHIIWKNNICDNSHKRNTIEKPSCFLDECSFWRNNLQYLDLCFSGLSSFSHLASWNSNLHPLHLVTLNMGWGTTSQSITLNSVSSSLCWSSLAFLFSARIWSHYHRPGMCRCFLYMHFSSISEAQYHRNYMNLIPRWPGFLALAGGANIYSQRAKEWWKGDDWSEMLLHDKTIHV